MLVLEIREFASGDDKGTALARLWLKGGKMQGEGSQTLLDSLRKGVEGADGATYTPKDGIGFLKAVQESYAETENMTAKLVSNNT